MGYMRLQKLYNVVVPPESETTAPSAEKKAHAFAELVQCLDDRSLSLVIREANNDGRKALRVLREHYQGKGKPRIIALYTELTSLRMNDGETTTDYIIRAETAATALKAAGEVISDSLLVAMALKGLPSSYRAFATVVMQREKQMTFAEFKTALRSHEENERCCRSENDGVMLANASKALPAKFQGNCYKCGKKGHKTVNCYSHKVVDKWCQQCRTKSHNTKECRVRKTDAAKTAAEPQRKREISKNMDSVEHYFTFTVKDQSGLGKKQQNSLLFDSGATSHIVTEESKFLKFDLDFKAKDHVVELADGSKANVVLGRGEAKVKLYDINGNLHDVILNNALYIPSYTQNIFSVSAAVERGASINLNRKEKYFKAPDGTKFEIEQKGRLYYLNSISSSHNNASSLMEWHKIMGHCNFQDLRKLSNVVDGMRIKDDKICECAVCTQGKMCQFRNRKPDERAKAALNFVHCDLTGPISPEARDGFKYTLCFVDDYTGIIMVYFLKQKSDTVEATKKFLADTAPYGKIKRIRSDNGGEFSNKAFRSLLRENTIKHETSCPYSPHQNGSAERAWRSLFEMARCLLLESKLPKQFWTYALMTSAHIRNRCFNARLGKTPYEALVGNRPDISHMQVFGSTCYAYVQNAKKLEARSKKGIFVGYDKESPSYLVYFPESNKIERVRCVKFFQTDNSPHFDEDALRPAVDPTKLTEGEHDEVTSNSTETESQSPGEQSDNGENDKRYPPRTRNKPQHLEDYVLDTDSDDDINVTVDYCYRVSNIPTSYEEAINSIEGLKWQKAMSDEMTAIRDNDTFELVTPPAGRKIVGGRWVFAVKVGPDGGETHKARYVAKGYSQTAGIDYHETFAPTARMSSVRLLMQQAVQTGMIIHQMDVRSAYLNAPIGECEVFMQQPKGFEEVGENGEKLVCRLKKSLYGLKQSGRNWNNMLHNYLCEEKFVQSAADSCVYTHNSETEGRVIIIVWVDDLIISATNLPLLKRVKGALSNKFKMKDLGPLAWFLGTEFKCSEESIEINQTQYIDKILKKFEMSDCKPKSVPCAPGIEKESEASRTLSDPRLYREIVGSLIYVMTGTRPELCYVVTKLSQKMSCPTESDLSMAKHVLRYLKGTRAKGLTFCKSRSALKLVGFCDADWGASVKDRRSITGYNFQLSVNGPLISWKSRKQPTVALSTCEAEYISLANAVQEAKFLKQLCSDMNVVIDNVLIKVDNQGAINLAKNPVNHQRSKHIDIKYHFIRSEVLNGNVNLEYVATQDNVADIFTKPVTKVTLQKFTGLILGS